MILRARQAEFSFPRPAIIMGILNVTPDSFSDGGQFLDPKAAIDRAFVLVAEGAEIIDIGGESTRPNSVRISEAEEWRRVRPVLEGLSGKLSALISIDTYKPSIASRAIEMGAGMINDVASNRHDRRMADLVAEKGVAYIAMHMQGTPETMQVNPNYENVVQEVGEFFEARLQGLREAGVKPEQVALDVGIGFGKSRQHNLELLRRMGAFGRFGRPMMVGISRKSFLGNLDGAGVENRLPAALACSCWAVEKGVQILRTHDVAATCRAVRMWEEISAMRAGDAK